MVTADGLVEAGRTALEITEMGCCALEGLGCVGCLPFVLVTLAVGMALA